MESQVTYTTASGRWRRSGNVNVLSIHDTQIATFPMAFLQSCGDNTWRYILFVISLLVNVASDHPGELFDPLGHPVSPQDAPVAGTFRYIERGEERRASLNAC